MGLNLRRIKYPLIIGCIVVLAGFLAITGWQFNINIFKSLTPDISAMNPVTAATLMLSGAWLILYYNAPRSQLPIFIIDVVVIIVGAVHLTTYFIPLNGIRFDYLLYAGKIRQSNADVLIAPNTAMAFLLNGVAMMVTSARRRWVQLLRQWLIVASFSLVYISLAGYFYDVRSAYRNEHFASMSLYTALVFLVLNTGLFLSNAHFGLAKTFVAPFSGGRLIRRAFPFVLGLPLLTGYLRLLGEQKGLFSMEYGSGLNSLVFTLAVFLFISLYAALENNRQMLQMRTEQQLAASEKKFRSLFNTLSEGVASVNMRGRILYCNPGLSNITGYTGEELAGKNAIELFIPKTDRAAFYNNLQERLGAAHEHYEAEVIRKDGEKIWIALQLTPILSDDNTTEAVLVTVNDITQDKLKIEDLTAFTASAAHDLNAPLARIIMVMSAIETDNLTDEQKMFLDAIASTSKNMRLLLQDLLTFSRLGTGQLEKARVDMQAIAREVCATEQPPNFSGAIIINDLPPATGNASAIRQLYTNLVSNAIKYSSGKEHPRIEIGAYRNRRRTVYYVTDNGTGLTAESLKQLFTPFKRFHHDIPGNGMGLAIVKRIVEKHGGRIWAESTPGNGLTFNFTLSPEGHAAKRLQADI